MGPRLSAAGAAVADPRPRGRGAVIPLLRPGRVADSSGSSSRERCELLDLLAENQTSSSTSRRSATFPGGQSLLDTLHAEIEGVAATAPVTARAARTEACLPRNGLISTCTSTFYNFRFIPCCEENDARSGKTSCSSPSRELLRRGVTVERRPASGITARSSGGGARLLRREDGEHLAFALPHEASASLRPRADAAATAIDCEHFLPKSLHPVLSVHPANLLFICIPCNRTTQGRARHSRGTARSRYERSRWPSGALFNSLFTLSAGPLALT